MNSHGPTLGLLLFLAAGCAQAGGTKATAPAPAGDAAASITRQLEASAEAWNRGDLDGFLQDYDDAESTTFVGGSGLIRGLDEIRRRYRTGYWAAGRPEHRLRFDDVEVRPLGPDHALAVGRYILAVPASGEVAATGMFSLIFARTDHGWKIIHDHSSASSP